MVLYSHSRLSTFERCTYKYKLKYLDKVKAETTQGVEAFMGSMVHDTLERVYIDKQFEKVMTLKEAQGYLKALWKKNWNDQIIIVRKEYGEENYFKMALKFIKMYFDRFYPFDDGLTIGLEDRVIIKLDKAGRYKLQGYIDRLASFKDGEYHIVDYKTNRHLKIQDQLDQDRQLALYQLAVMKNYRDAKKVVLKWHFLAFDKTLTSTRTKEELEALRKNTIQLIKTIEKCKEFKTNKSKLCDWCEFRSMCPEWSHLHKLEQKNVNEYLKDDGVKLVNEFVKLSTKKKELLQPIDEKLEKIKEALVKFAKDNGVSVVFGSNNRIKVAIYDQYKVPAIGSKERIKLEALLKKLKRWEEVSTINYFALNKLIKGLDKTTQKQITKYTEKEETSRFYPSKIKKDEDLTK